MSKQNTRATIDANIKQNGQQLITGQILNSVLNTMVTDYAEQAETTEKLTDLERKVGDLSDLETEDKTSLVAAINEAAQTGGGGGSVSGFVVIESVSDLPTNPTPSQQTLGYLLDRNLIVYVGSGGDMLDGKYKDCGEIKGIKGDKGDPGEPGPQGERGEQGERGLRGLQGNTGSSVDYPFTLVNNLVDGGTDKALTAEMGKYLKDTLAPFFEEAIANTADVGYVSGYLAAQSVGAVATPTSGATLRTSVAIPVSVGMTCTMKSQGTGIAAIAWSATENGTYYAKAISSVSSGEQLHSWIVDQDGFIKFSSRNAVYDGHVVVESERDLTEDIANWDKIPSINEKIEAVYPEVIQGVGSITDITSSLTVGAKQSYGTVGAKIQFQGIAYNHYRVPASSGANLVRFYVPSGSNPSSLIQYVDSTDTILSLDATSSQINVGTMNEFALVFPEGADAVYVSGDRTKLFGVYVKEGGESLPHGVIGNLSDLQTKNNNTLVESINEVKQATNIPFRFRYLSWNIGHFAKGNATESAITPETYEQTKRDFRKLFNEQAADFCGLCEFSPIFYPETSETAKEAIFSQYKYDYIGYRTGGYEGLAFFSNCIMTDAEEWTWGNLRCGNVRIKVGGKEIVLCEVHIPWSNRDSHNNAIDYVLDKFKDDPYVIIAGDFNLYADEEMTDITKFTSAGYVPANWGYMGKILTSYNNVINSNYLDNIMVKGGSILNTHVVQNTPEGKDPDHPNPDDEHAWDAVNLSDHFPIICDIAF